MIRVRDLEFDYGGDFRLAVRRFHVPRGATVACVGASGCGKTTLLNLIAGIVTPASGTIETNGVAVTALSEGERRNFRITNVGLVFQEFELLDYLTVLDNVLLPYRINPTLRLDPDVRRRAADLASQVGIGDKLARFPRHLSQGERQRVAVCRAVLPQPALVLADEPTGNLDPENTDKVLEILFDYVARHDAALLTVTHDHELLPRFERVVDFNDLGGLVESVGSDSTVPVTAEGGLGT